MIYQTLQFGWLGIKEVNLNLWNSALWQDCFTLFLSLVVQAMPFLLLGVMVSGILAVFVDEQQIMRWLPRGRWSSSIAGGLLGFFFPVCECGNLPVARRLVTKGVPPYVAIAFLLAAPVFNPVVIFVTWLAFRNMPEIVIYRVALSFAIAVAVGLIFSFQKDLEPLLSPAVLRELQAKPKSGSSSRPSLLQGGTFLIQPVAKLAVATEIQTAQQVYETALDRSSHLVAKPATLLQKLKMLLDIWTREVQELGSVLILGAATAALIQTLMPRTFFLDYGQGPVISVLVMLGLATLVSICSTVDAFFALSFAATFTSGSLLAFLVFGPMIDLKSIGLMTTLFKPRAIVYMTLLTLQFTLIGALAVNFYGS